MPEPDTSTRLPSDSVQRQRILTERSKSIFVEAGAGTGKTRALVDRVAALVTEDGVPMDSIAMITFTDKAAVELRDRIRERFERSPSPRARLALQQLDAAAVGTLHSFAQRILAEHPVEAGLPPGIEVLDEIGSQIEFEQQWQEFCNDLLEDHSAAQALLSLEAIGVGLDPLRALARQMSNNWDLIEQRLDLNPSEMRPLDSSALLAQFDRVLALRVHCSDPTDKLFLHLEKVAKNRAELANAFDHIEALYLVDHMAIGKNGASKAVKPGISGKQRNWAIEVDEVRDEIRALGQQCDQVVRQISAAALAQLGARIGKFVLSTAEARRVAGSLQFHDLLVRARQLLRHETTGDEVRAALNRQYTHLLLDEFQDTDPIQIEIAVLIATNSVAVGNRDWRELPVEPGRLFFVGDPKQSIYRFRRADISLYLTARDHYTDRASLTVNFRTVQPIIGFINDVFSALIKPAEGSQPNYEALSAFRLGHDTQNPAVAILGSDPITEPLRAAELRERETADVAAALRDVLAAESSWQVEDPETGWRKARPSDVCILLPTRNSLTSLQRALEASAIPYRAETSSLVYNSREVRELMLTLRAISDPTDELATVSALRSFVYGCGDDDLANWRHAHNGRFSFIRPLPDGYEHHVVGEALEHLQRLHQEHHWYTPASLLDRLIRERAVLESAAATGAGRDVWRRLRFVVDQARAWSSAGGTGLRAYLEWARRQGDESARVSENVLPETDDDSVRIMTIHGSKGLEFPITVLAGMTDRFTKRERGPVVHYPPNQPPILKISSRIASQEYENWKPLNEAMEDHERLRLLYVAATRARDHLILCLHRLDAGRKERTNATVLAEPALGSKYGEPFVPSGNTLAPFKKVPRRPLLERSDWQTQRTKAIGQASRPQVVTATALARSVAAETSPGLEKDGANLDWSPWRKGRYGTAVGRAVHGVLQEIDLASGAGLEEAVATQVAAEGVRPQRSVVERMTRTALASNVAQQASIAEHWREVWVGAHVGGRLVEGYIDLLYRQGSDLVVVDWKTDHVGNEEDLSDKLDRYRLQGASYVAALEAATRLNVKRMVFVFLSDDDPIEREIDNLRGAVAEVKQRTSEL